MRNNKCILNMNISKPDLKLEWFKKFCQYILWEIASASQNTLHIENKTIKPEDVYAW